MIIVGCYPHSFESHQGVSPLQTTISELEVILPENAAVHLLPFYPSSGDFGFAPDSLLQVDPELGSWGDIKVLCSKRKCVFDGIYNHVGNNHDWVKAFYDNPIQLSRILHAYQFSSTPNGPISPRGQPALQPAGNGVKDWFLWRTFTESAVDVRLENPIVRAYVQEHLEVLTELGAWAVRLDAVAYYKKSLEGSIRHNPGANALAGTIAKMAQQHGLQVFAQLNRDEEGLGYFKHSDFRNVGINDFTYPLFLLLSLVHHDPRYLVEYEDRLNDEKIALRAPRTHDGILLRSKSIKEDERNKLIETFRMHNLEMRMEGGTPYEFNCSLPYLLNRCFLEHSSLALELIVAITCMSSGIAYLYLPMLVGFSPESEARTDGLEGDPRALNRHPITSKQLQRARDDGWLDRVRHLLDMFGRVRNDVAKEAGVRFETRLRTEGPTVLSLESSDGRYTLVANLGLSKAVIPKRLRNRTVLISKGLVEGELAAFGYALSAHNENANEADKKGV